MKDELIELITEKLIVTRYYKEDNNEITYKFKDIEKDKTVAVSEDNFIQLLRAIDLLARGE